MQRVPLYPHPQDALVVFGLDAPLKGEPSKDKETLVVQTIGNMSVDLIVEMFRQIPTMKCVKDEVGIPLERVTPCCRLRAKAAARTAAIGCREEQ